MTKKEFEQLVQDYCFELYRDMDERELRSYVLNIMYQEKILMWPEHLVSEVRKKYPHLLNENEGEPGEEQELGIVNG